MTVHPLIFRKTGKRHKRQHCSRGEDFQRTIFFLYCRASVYLHSDIKIVWVHYLLYPESVSENRRCPTIDNVLYSLPNAYHNKSCAFEIVLFVHLLTDCPNFVQLPGFHLLGGAGGEASPPPPPPPQTLQLPPPPPKKKVLTINTINIAGITL